MVGATRSSGPSGGGGNGLRVVNLRAVPWGFLRAVERDFFVDYVEKPTDQTRWRGRLFRWKLCCWEAFENEPGRRRWKHESEVQMNARPRPTQSEFFERSSLLKPPAEAPAIRLVDDQFPSWQPSVGSLVPLGRVSRLVLLGKLGRLYPLAFARYLIAFSIGVAVAFTWQSYGNATREATSLKAILLDIDAVRQSIDRITTSVATGQEQMTRRIEHSIERNTDRLATGQDETTREISDLQTFEQYVLHRISMLPPRPAPTTASKAVLRSPQAPIQLIPARNP